MNRITLAICAFFGLALVLYWQVQVKRNEQALIKDDSIERPDYVADNLHTKEFNQAGLIESQMTAKHMVHFASDDSTIFKEPVLLVAPEESQSLWQITAKEARLNRQDNSVTLQHDVRINAVNVDEPIQELTTQYVMLDLNTMLGHSEEKVLIKGQGFTIEGLGLFADSNAEKLTLLSQVEGTYESR